MGTVIDITRQRFGRLRAIELAYVRQGAYWFCECDCGAVTVQRGSKLRSGTIVSCGCQRRDAALKRALRLLLPRARRAEIARMGARAKLAGS